MMNDARGLAEKSGVPSIAILLTWFGRWPSWFRFFLASCRANSSIQWFVISNCGVISDLPANVTVIPFELDDYRSLIENRLNIDCAWRAAYKLCDLKPALGYLHTDLISDYDFWGFGDIDVVYGDIRSIYTSQVLSYDIISSHEHITAGHLTLIRNVKSLNTAFKGVRGWRKLLSRADHRGFDEFHWSHRFTPLRGNMYERLKQRIRSPKFVARTYLAEQFSSALYPLRWINGGLLYPDYWYWRGGELTAEGAGSRQFLYLHFTNWQSDRWNEGNRAAWNKLDSIDHCPPGYLNSFRIGPDGFYPTQ